MMAISSSTQENQRHCDELYASVEESAANGDWDGADSRWQASTPEFDAHITEREEGELFPSLEATGGPPGPVAMMRMELEQLRSVVAQMNDALAARNQQQFSARGRP